MKKFFLSIVLTAFAASLFAMQATVVSTKGKAEVQNGNSWVALKPGDSLSQGSVIQTGFKSEVVIKIKDSTITVSPLSRLTLQSLVERNGANGANGKDDTTIKLDTGSLKSSVQKSEDRRVGFTVRSPVATASVRGTEFSFSTKYKSTKLSTSQGSVAFWKNTKQSEQALDNQNEGPAGEAGEGNEAQDISEVAPASAIVVSQGEMASVTVGSGMKDSSAMAKENSTSIGLGTATAASAESEFMARSGISNKSATIIVDLQFADD